jgi:cytidylate kinase
VKPPLITVSATYGAGGSVVAPALAQRLGVPLLRRVTTTSGSLSDPGLIGERLSSHEKRIVPAGHLLASLAQAIPAGPTLSPPSMHRQHEELRRQVEAEIDSFTGAGGGVILGRGAAVVLGKDRGYHVRLDGPLDRRLAQGAEIEHITAEQALDHEQAADQARTAYVRRLYRVDPADAALYHLVIDSTVIPLDAVVDLILTAAEHAGKARRPLG